MNTRHESRIPPALQDLALRRAQELRGEAINDFWRGADAVWVASLATARRSAQRLAHRLARRAQCQATPPVDRLEG